MINDHTATLATFEGADETVEGNSNPTARILCLSQKSGLCFKKKIWMAAGSPLNSLQPTLHLSALGCTCTFMSDDDYDALDAVRMSSKTF